MGVRALAVPRSQSGPRTSPRTSVGVGRATVILGGLSVTLVIVAILGVAIGEEFIAPGAIIGMALQWLPIHPTRTWSETDLTIITLFRVPRVLTGIMVGSALAMAGTAFQALFRNSLADPGIVGTSAGASMGAVIALVLPIHIALLGFTSVSIAAFIGALTTMLAVYSLARVRGRVPSTTLLLAGFAVTASLNAAAAMIETLSDRVREVYIWLLGSLDQTTADQLAHTVPLLAIGIVGLLMLSRSMNVLLLGDEQSEYLGLNVTRQRLLILVLGSLLTSVAVALAGMIAFVGLLIPHVSRLLFGTNHRLLLPAAALMGGTFLVIMDIIARTALRPQELPVGLITAIIGGPWFLFLLRRKRGEYSF